MPPKAKGTKGQPGRAKGRKRPVSETASQDDSDWSIQDASQSVRHRSSSPKPRQKKRAKQSLVQETQTAVHTQVQESSPPAEEPALVDTQVHLQPPPSRNVRWSDIGVARPNFSTPPASQESGQHSRPDKNERRRVSLPPNFTSLANGQQEVQFEPLMQILDERVKRRLRRSHLSEEQNAIEEHQKEDAKTRQELRLLREAMREKNKQVEELSWDLESQRQLAISVEDGKSAEAAQKVKEMEVELNKLRSEISELHAQGMVSPMTDLQDFNDMDASPLLDTPDDEPMVLVEPNDLNIRDQSPINESEHGHHTVDTMRTVDPLPEPSHEAETKQFERNFFQLSNELSTARAEFQVLEIELQSMGFAASDVPASGILTAMRTAFRDFRTQLDGLVDEDPNRFENGPLLEFAIEVISRQVGNIRDMTQEIRQHEQLQKTMWSQNSGLLDKLAETGERNKHLESQWTKMDVDSEAKSKAILELEENLDKFEGAIDERDGIIAEQNETIEKQNGEIEDQAKSLERLKGAVQNYRNELDGLESLVTTLEEQHAAKVEELETAHAVDVELLQEKIENAEAENALAEADIEERDVQIGDLETKLEDTQSSLDATQAELTRLQEVHSQEIGRREEAEDDLEGCRAQIDDLEAKMDEAEKTLAYLRNEVDVLGKLASAEKTSRENAELEIEERDESIKDLEEKLSSADQTAHDLRTSLESLKTLQEEQIARLEEQTKQRESELQEVIDTKITKQKETEELASQRLELIEKLEEDIRYIDSRLSSRDGEFEKLQADFEATEESHQDTLAEKDSDLDAISTELQKATADISSLKSEREDLQNQLSIALADFDNEQRTVADLTVQLEAEQDRANGAEQVAADKSNQITSLENHLSTTRAEVSELTATVNRGNQEIHHLHEIINDLKRRVQTEVERGQAGLAEAINAMREGLQQAEEKQASFIHEGEMAISEANAVGISGRTNGNGVAVQPTVASPTIGRWIMSKVSRRSNRRRYDSGYVEESDEGESIVESPTLAV